MYNYKQFILENKLVDPFGEEDWDEVDSKIIIIKVWIGAQTKEIRLIYYPAYIQNSSDKCIILNDKFRKLHMCHCKDLDDHAMKGIPSGNCYIIHESTISAIKIHNFVKKYLNDKKSSCHDRINKYERLLNSEFENDDEQYEYENGEYGDIDEKLEKDRLLFNNISNFNIKENISRILKSI